MGFVNDILNYNSLSIVGLEKNTGKTECLKYVLNNIPLDNKKVAVTSIGLDGESTDQVTQTKKPEIFLRKGMYFGTSETHYHKRKILSELIDVSDEQTSLGRVVTAKALTRGKVLLSGPSSSAGLQRWIADMHNKGIDLTIVDGALSRLSLASPAVSKSMILATGAAYSANMSALVHQTAYIVGLINIETTNQANIDRLLPLEKGVWTIDKNNTLRELPNFNALSQKIDIPDKDNVAVLYLTGALVDGFLDKIQQDRDLRQTEIIVRDFTKIFVSPQKYASFIKKGGVIHVLQRSKLLAVTVNPTSPSGYVLDSTELCEKLSESINLPTYDIFRCN